MRSRKKGRKERKKRYFLPGKVGTVSLSSTKIFVLDPLRAVRCQEREGEGRKE
jgi:hypothetical protein